MPGPPPTAYLKGGPCNGTTRKLTGAELDSGTLTCNGATYNHTNNLHNGDVVFQYASSSGGSGDGSGSGVKSTGIHKGWNDLRKTFNHKIPAGLGSSQRMTAAALRKLEHARRVRIR